MYPDQPFSRFVLDNLVGGPHPLEDAAKMAVIPASFVAGWGIAWFGALVRRACYRHMKHNFTFEVAVLENHTLVTTGPYAWVRHPGYASAFAIGGGITTAMVARGSYLTELLGAFEGRPLLVRAGIGGFAVFVAWIFTNLARRMRVEDELMHKHFGKEWEDWASRVRCWLVPRVY